MQLKFRQDHLDILVVTTPNEDYVSSSAHKELHKRAMELRAKVQKFQEEEVFPEVKSIQDIVDKLNAELMKSMEK